MSGIVTDAVQIPAAVFAVRFPGQVTVGAISSVTVTVKLQDAVRLAASVTVTFTWVVPTLNVCAPGWPVPESSVAPVVLHAIDEPGQLSPKTIAGMIMLFEHPLSTLSSIFAGQAMVGFWLSAIVTVKLQVAVFGVEAPSATVTATLVTPLLKVTPSSVLYVPSVAPESTYVFDATVQLSVAVTSQPIPLWV